MWICGQFKMLTDKGSVWEFQGIFSTESLAINACRNDNYFIAPVVLDESVPDELCEWYGLYYPLSNGGK